MSKTANISQFLGKSVYFINNKKRLGKIHNVVFFPDDTIAYGFAVRRKPILFMFKRKDLYFSRSDIIFNEEGPAFLKEDAVWSDPRMVKNFVIWLGQELYTESNTKLGCISDINLDMDTGQIQYLSIGKSMVSNLVLGQQKIDSEYIIGLDYYNDDCCIRIKDSFIPQQDKQGLAYNAGKAGAKIKNSPAHAMQDKAAKNASENIEKGAYKLGSQIAKSKGMFSEFKEEFKKAKE